MTSKRRFWSTLEEYEKKQEVDRIKGEEFFSKPEAIINEDLSIKDQSILDPSRRDFLKLSGVAAVLAMVGCSERKVEKILPYVNAPEEIIPGVANYYASASDEASAGILVKTREGRPINILPNDLDTESGSGLNARAYASLYDLYDPDRAQGPATIDRNGVAGYAMWEDAYSSIAKRIKKNEGDVVLLTGTINSPSTLRLINDLKLSIPRFKHIMTDAFSNDQLQKANQLCFGTTDLPRYRFDKAKTVVFLGGDLFSDGRDSLKNIADFAKNRKVHQVKSEMSRVFAFEPTITETGANSDYRYAVKNEDMALVALALCHYIISKKSIGPHAGKSELALLTNYSAEKVETVLKLTEGSIAKTAEALIANQGTSIVYAEGNANKTENGLALHIAVNLLNSSLNNIGKTIDYTHSISYQSMGSNADLQQLINDCNENKVTALMIYGTNPSYFLANTDQFNTAIKKAKVLVSFAQRMDETAFHCDYLLPSTHSFESWGDRQYIKGKYNIVQPTINPIWDNRCFEDSLIQISKSVDKDKFVYLSDFYSFVQETWKLLHKKNNIAVSFDKFWTTIIRDGVYDENPNRNNDSETKLFSLAALSSVKLKEFTDSMTLSVYFGSTMFDGSQGNNPYLYEAPDPVTKLTWDNVLLLSPETARKLKVWIGSVVDISVNGVMKRLPVNIQPGTHPNVACVMAGWGHHHYGSVANGIDKKGTGVNAFAFTQSNFFSGQSVSVTATGETIKLADTQGHQYLDDKQRFIDLHNHHAENYRPILFDANLNEYLEHEDKILKYHTDELTHDIKANKIPNMWNMENKNVHNYPGHRWGMHIDTNSCIGCNACSIACSIENNVPVVGKEEVIVGREMHWIRIDRYYVGTEENPQVIHQPMMCQHCSNAPCETVCPVVATTHNGEGLNVMTYNRCVGTRYCANNCPYKVRRFNFHEYTKGMAIRGFVEMTDLGLGENRSMNRMGYDLSKWPMQMMLNPEVTVREKGVMEKCTMCIHKIRDSRYEAKLKGVSINDLDNLSTACELACPANAITFGDLNDPESDLSKLKSEKIAFGSLAELNTEPAISYFAKIRNQDEAILFADHSNSHTNEH